MNLKQKLLCLFFFILCGLTHQDAKSSHVMGTDFAYECLDSGKYKIILNVYRDCNGTTMTPSISYRYKCYNGTGTVFRRANRVRLTDVTGLDSACGSYSKCIPNSTFPYGIQQHVYIDTIDLSSLNCCEVVLYYDVCCRNHGISTGSNGQNFYSQMTINKCLSSCNSSPKYTNLPVAIVCKDQDVVLNSGAVDTIDFGDSLSYELTTSLTNASSNVTYSGNFAYNSPLTFLGFPNQNLSLPSGFHLDPTRGDLSFRPTVLNEISVVAIKVKEWRKDSTGTWQQIGESRRDMQIISINCASIGGNQNVLPQLHPAPIARVCSGDSVCVKIVASDSNANDTVRLSWNTGIPGASFSVANPGSRLDTAYVCWKPNAQDTSSVPYAFTITAKDNACPFPGTTTRAYAIQVGLNPETRMKFSVDTCGLIEMQSDPLAIYVDPVFTWTITDSAQDTLFHSASLNKSAYAFLDPGKYYIDHRISSAFPCYSDFRDSFVVAPYPVIRSSLPSDTSVCQNSTLQLSSTVNGGVAPLRYSWSTSLADTSDTLSVVIDRDSMVVVTVTDVHGCFHRDTVDAISMELPVSKIYIDDSDQCFKGNSFSFIDSTALSSGTLSRVWHFGNGDSSTSEFPVYSYNTFDTFQVALFSETDFGCVDSAYDSVLVHPQAVPKIQFNDSAQCFRVNNYVFDALASTIPYEQIHKWYWDFGDSTQDTTETTYKSYSRHGFMQVRLITETQSACLDTVVQQVRVNPHPEARIDINDSLVCLSENEVQLSALNAQVAEGNIAQIDWLFGDGSLDTGWFPAAHHYLNPDTFWVRVSMLSDQQCEDTAWQKVVIHPQSHVDLKIDSSDACLSGNHFFFDGSASTVSSGSILYYDWSFNDGQSDTGSLVNHSYATADTFQARLITTTALLCRDTAFQKIIVHPQAQPDFVSNADSQCLNLNDFSYDANLSSIDWGYIDKLQWDFGDGQSDTGWFVPSISYGKAGPYQVRLITQSDFGCLDTVYHTRQVHPRAVLHIQTNYQDHCLSFNSFLFDASGSTIPWGTIDAYHWRLKDGANLNGVQPAAYSFASADSFGIRLLTVTNYGCLDTLFSQVVVHPMPVSSLVYNEDQHCLNGNDFQFDAGASTIATGSLAKYEWDFGDGKSATGPFIAQKIYSIHGTHTLKIRVESALGCADSILHPIVVHPQMVPELQILDSFVCVNGNFFDIDATPSSIPYGNIVKYEWDFREGVLEYGIRMEMQNFSYYDTFDVHLKTYSDKGCTDSMYREIVVYPKPKALFVVNDSIQCFDKYQSFSFDASDSYVPKPWPGVAEYLWSSSDNDQHNGVKWPDKKFANRGVYTIQLRAKSLDGCRDTMEKQVLFYPAMEPSFVTSDTAQCFNEHSFVFDASSSRIPLGWIQNYTWKYEDLTSSNGLNSPPKRFADFDTFTVWLITTSNERCEDSVSNEVIVFESPKAKFSVPETCLKQASVFTDLTEIAHDALIAWYWDFGNEKGDTVQHPIHYYQEESRYDVKLQVQTNNNCFHDTIMPRVAWVKPLPVSKYSYTRTNFDFERIEYAFYDQSVDAITWDWSFGDGKTSVVRHPSNEYGDTAHYLVQLIVSNEFSCLDTSHQTVWAMPDFMVFVPNAFTPNGDVKNDGFGPKATAYYQRYSMKVYNRWGQLIFETDSLSDTWDGTFRGEVCQSGVYAYTISILDMKGKIHNLKGNVTLLK